MADLRHRPWLIATGASLLAAGCGGVLDPVGPVGGAGKADPHQLDRDHARDHHSDDDRDDRLRLVVPARQHQGDLSAGLGIFGRDRNGGVGDPGADHHAAWRNRLDRQPRPRAEQAAASKVPPLNVEVVSLDWKWLFIYPTRASRRVNQLVVPAGTPVSFRLTSATVWNAFFVPQMGTMIYTMPRMTTRLNLQADKPRSLSTAAPRISAATASPGMQFKVQAVPADQFAMWAQRRPRRRPMLDGRGYAAAAEAQQLCEADDLWRWSRRGCSTRSSRTDCRRRTPSHRRRAMPLPQHHQDARPMFGKLTWDAIPFNQPIPLITSLIVLLRSSARSPSGSPDQGRGRICGTSTSRRPTTSASASCTSCSRW